MKRDIIQTKKFSKSVDNLLKKGQLSQEDFNDFIKKLAEYPEAGDVMVGTGGVRKIRLKSSSKGKRGGFRVCYFYFQIKEKIYLFALYAKNEKADLTTDEKKILKEYADFFKRGY